MIDRPVFVTGASGLLGGWLVKRLLELKADVVCLMRDWVPQSELVHSGMMENVKVVRGSICDQPLIERILGEYEIDTVFHLAAQTIVGIANRNPISTFESDIQGTWTVLEACRRSPKIRSIVVASSDKCYKPLSPPYKEDAPLQGFYPYDASKSCADIIAQSFGRSFGLPVVVTRCGNIYGGGDLNWNRLVPGTIRSIIRGQQPIIRSDGKYVRDYFYVEDAVEAYILLAENVFHGEAFNFSNENPLNVTQVVSIITSLMGSDLQPIIKNEASNETRELYLDSQKARNLGWRPRYFIEEGLLKTIKWYRNYFG